MDEYNKAINEINNTSFNIDLNNLFRESHDDVLKEHQIIVVDYIKRFPGILVQHDLGTGKSLIAASIIASMIPEKEVIILSTKSLHNNMANTIKELEELKKISIDPSRYKFITMNASNMIKQFEDVNESDELFDVVSKISLDNKVLIVDEAHNLFNSITNGSGNSIKLYNEIMKCLTLKIVFMSGTPIVNHPFELVPCFNMLARKEILPIHWDDFNKYFIDPIKLKIKNKEKFQNRITGFVSYYGSFYNKIVHSAEKIDKKENFPDRYPPQMIECHMSKTTFHEYARARDIELHEASMGPGKITPLSKPKNMASSSYRRLSRQFSNLVIPSAIKYHKNTIQLDVGRVTDNDLINPEHSMKWDTIFKNIQTDGKNLIYSSFVQNAGIALFARYMKLKNFIEVYVKDDKIIIDDEFVSENKRSKKIQHKFIIITGDIPPNDRYRLIEMFNDPKNNRGQNCLCILISGAGAEGLNLKCINYIHVMEPYWNWMRIEQVIGRGVRYKSHIDLPLNRQWVKTYIYLSVYPKETDSVLPASEEPTDVKLLKTAIDMMKLTTQFYIAMAEASIDCSIHNKNTKLKCHLCAPTNTKLYTDDIAKDIERTSPCKDMSKESVVAEEIIVDGQKYAYYKSGNITELLKWNEHLDSYVPMERSDPKYNIILNNLII